MIPTDHDGPATFSGAALQVQIVDNGDLWIKIGSTPSNDYLMSVEYSPKHSTMTLIDPIADL